MDTFSQNLFCIVFQGVYHFLESSVLVEQRRIFLFTTIFGILSPFEDAAMLKVMVVTNVYYSITMESC